MDLHQLQTFVIVAEECSITRAAKRLYSTPSSISMQIKALEDELGVQLFTRSNQGVLITPKGEQLREKAIITLQAAQDMVNHATDLVETLVGTVSLGLCSDLAVLKIPQLVQRVQSTSPGIDLRIEHSTSSQIIAAVVEQRLDIGFVFGSPQQPHLAVQRLTPVELWVVAPAKWQHTAELSDWRQIAALPWVSVGRDCPFQTTVDTHLAGYGTGCSYRVQIDDDRSRSELVKAGLGLSLLESHSAQQGIAEGSLLRVPVPSLSCDLHLIYRAHNQYQPLIRCVIGLIEQLFDGLP